MPVIDKLYLAVLTRDEDNAGSDSPLNVIVNIGGIDVVSHYVVYQPDFDIKRGMQESFLWPTRSNIQSNLIQNP